MLTILLAISLIILFAKILAVLLILSLSPSGQNGPQGAKVEAPGLPNNQNSNIHVQSNSYKKNAMKLISRSQPASTHFQENQDALSAPGQAAKAISSAVTAPEQA